MYLFWELCLYARDQQIKVGKDVLESKALELGKPGLDS